MHARMYVCMYVCMYVWVDGWTDARREVCMYVHMYACMYIYIYIYMSVCMGLQGYCYKYVDYMSMLMAFCRRELLPLVLNYWNLETPNAHNQITAQTLTSGFGAYSV